MIPVRNGAAFVEEAIASALAQEERDAEIVVVDNASTDFTADVVRAFNDPRLRYIRNDHDLGMVGNWNRCIELAAGEFITLLHHDDRWLPGFLARARRLFDAYPKAEVVYGGCRIVDTGGRLLRLHQPFPELHVWTGERELEVLIRGNYIYCPTVVYRASALKRVGGFNPRLKLAPDWELLLRLALVGSVFIYDPEPMSEYYERDDSVHAIIDGELRTGEEHIVALLGIARELAQTGEKIQAAYAETLNLWANREVPVALDEFMNLRLVNAARHFFLAYQAAGSLRRVIRKVRRAMRKRGRNRIRSRG